MMSQSQSRQSHLRLQGMREFNLPATRAVGKAIGIEIPAGIYQTGTITAYFVDNPINCPAFTHSTQVQ